MSLDIAKVCFVTQQHNISISVANLLARASLEYY